MNKYIFFLTFLAAVPVQAQDTQIPEGDAYVPDTLYAVRNAVKVDPIQIVFGDFRIFYERILSERWSAEAGIGFTRRNYTAGWFDYDLDNFGVNIDIRTGYSLSLTGRFYFRESEELDGPYVSTGFHIKNYKKDYHVIGPSGELTGDVYTDQRKYLSLIAVAGIQALSYSGNIFADVYTGPAIRFKSFDQVRASDVSDPSTFYIRDKSEVVFGWELGLRVGFGF